MKAIPFHWNQLRLSRKFNLIFFLLFCLLLLIAATAYFSFLSIRNAEDDIRRNTEFALQVLEMDRGKERAQRLLGDFFLNYRKVGLQKAHEQYAQPSIRQIAHVISQSSALKKTVFHSNLVNFSNISQTDVNLYLASAKRFADTSIKAVELLSSRVAPERGIEAQLFLVEEKLKPAMNMPHSLDERRLHLASLVQKYQIIRQRHIMQSAFNALGALHDAVANEASLQTEDKNRIYSLLSSYSILCQELLDVDLKISRKFQDFSLQKQIIEPVSKTLTEATEKEIELAQQRIDKVYRLAGLTIMSITLIAIMSMISLAKLLRNTVIGNILKLTESAQKFGKGHLTVRASEKSQDELGQLARIFNTMASQVESLVNSLEQKVVLRTAELTESESFYRQLFDHSTSGIAVYEAVDNGSDFLFKDFNIAGERIEGISRESLLGKRLTEVFPGMKKFGLLEVFRRVWKTGQPALHPVAYYQDERQQGWRENRVFKLPSGELITVFDDLSKEKQLEKDKHFVELRLQRAQKMEAIGLMAGGVAHDLNNILTGITGYPELLLLQLPADSALRQPIEAIHESGKRAATVVADLLTVARGVAMDRITANMNTLITEYLYSPESTQLHSIYQHVQYHKNLAADLPNIDCSPVHIKKCIMNLVNNAAEAIDGAGSITLETSTVIISQRRAVEDGLPQGKYIVLSIADTGAGIPEENLKHIFEPFYTKKVLGRSGTGLGLAVVWNTLEDHDGKIFVESSNKGTRFQLYFPVSNKEVIVQKADHTQEKHHGTNEHILIIDDEPVLRDIACQMLQTLDYTVDSVSSGEKAIEFLKTCPVDLLLIDMLMDPGMNGRQTYEEILTFLPTQKAIIVSGFSKSDDVKATLSMGAGGFIKKPYSMEQLGRTIQEVLKS